MFAILTYNLLSDLFYFILINQKFPRKPGSVIRLSIVQNGSFQYPARRDAREFLQLASLPEPCLKPVFLNYSNMTKIPWNKKTSFLIKFIASQEAFIESLMQWQIYN